MLISPVSSVALKKAVKAFEPFAGVVFDGKLVLMVRNQRAAVYPFVP